MCAKGKIVKRFLRKVLWYEIRFFPDYICDTNVIANLIGSKFYSKLLDCINNFKGRQE